MTKKYEGFTLVEMLIVMGILSVLMGIGVSVARFAVQRANNIQHQSAVDQLYQAVQSYYTDNRSYPSTASANSNFIGDDMGLAVGAALDTYVDAAFDGGAPAKFYYFSDSGAYPQQFLLCVSFSPDDGIVDDQAGGYCNGNGFGNTDVISTATLFTSKTLEADTATVDGFGILIEAVSGEATTSVWDGSQWTVNTRP